MEQSAATKDLDEPNKKIDEDLEYTRKNRKLGALANLTIYCGIAVTLASVIDLSKTQISASHWNNCFGGDTLYLGLGMIVLGSFISAVFQFRLARRQKQLNEFIAKLQADEDSQDDAQSSDVENSQKSKSQFFSPPRLVTVIGVFSSAAGIAMMEESLWHAGEYIFLTGIALRILGIILAFYVANKKEVYQSNRLADLNLFSSVRNSTKEISRWRKLATVGLFAGSAGGIWMTEEYLSSNNFTFPSFSNPAMIVFLVGVAITLLSMPMLDHYMSQLEKETQRNCFHNEAASVWSTPVI